MTPPPSRVAIFAAMPWECRPAIQAMTRVRKSRHGALKVWTGQFGDHREAVVVRTGIGLQRAAAAVEQVLADGERFGLIVSTGCAGGLDPELRPGDLVVAEALTDARDGRRHESNRAAHADLVRMATALRCATSSGSVLSVEEPLCTIEAKSDAYRRGFRAVEMEGAAIAAAAAARGIPFVAVRSILDDAATAIAPGGLLNEDTGQVRPLAAVRHILTNPGDLARLSRTHTAMRMAEETLRTVFRAWAADPAKRA